MVDKLTPDLDMARRHLTLLDEDAETFVFQIFDDSKRKDPSLARVLYGTLDEHAAELTRAQVRGAGVFVTVNRSRNGRRRKEDIGAYRSFWREADKPNLPALPIEPHFVIETSPGKYHEYILIEHSEALDTCDGIMERMVQDYGSDPNAKDRARVLRLAGFYHLKNPAEPHLVKIIHEGGGLPYTLEKVSAAIPPLKKEKKTASIIGEVIPEGQRNGKLTSLAGSMRNRGMSEAAIMAALREENKRCVPPLPDTEVASIARSVSGYPPAELPDEPSIITAAMSLTPDSSSEDIASIVQAATKTLGAVARQRVYATIKKNALLPLYAIKQEAAANFEDGEPDQLVLARKVIESYGKENILCTDGDVWTWKLDGVWQEAPDRAVKGKVHEVVETMADVTQNRVNGVFDILKTEIYKTRHLWNADNDLINFSNGTLRLSHNGVILEPHKREHYHNIQIPIAYDPDAPEPKHLHAFLCSVWPDDPESIGTLQELIGYLLTSDTRQQKIPMIVGPRRSGKGTIYRLLVKLLGNHNIAGPTLSSLQQPFGLQPLIGKALAVISDARLGSRAEQHAITERLLAVSGEDTLSIPRKYLGDWTGKLNTRFLILTNELPRLADASGALASRFIVLPMTESFLGREDHDLDNKLASELPSILNWAIEGLYRLKQRGRFIQPQSAREAIEELNDLGSPISAFIRDICIVQPGAEVVCKDLYDSWRAWCETQGREHPGTLQTFGRDLKAALPEVKTIQRRVEGQVLRLYSGAGIRGVTQCHALYAIVSPTLEDIRKEDIRQLPICKTNGTDNRETRVTARDSDFDDEDPEIMEVLE